MLCEQKSLSEIHIKAGQSKLNLLNASPCIITSQSPLAVGSFHFSEVLRACWLITRLVTCWLMTVLCRHLMQCICISFFAGHYFCTGCYVLRMDFFCTMSTTNRDKNIFNYLHSCSLAPACLKSAVCRHLMPCICPVAATACHWLPTAHLVSPQQPSQSQWPCSHRRPTPFS